MGRNFYTPGSDTHLDGYKRQAITKAAKDLGYIPNMLARGLKTSVSKEVAVIMPSITNPFYTSMTMGIEGEDVYKRQSSGTAPKHRSNS